VKDSAAAVVAAIMRRGLIGASQKVERREAIQLQRAGECKRAFDEKIIRRQFAGRHAPAMEITLPTIFTSATEGARVQGQGPWVIPR
jgi:hypothetical protein